MTIPTESERRQATIMFADISGFTAMSEKMDPEEVTALMNQCFEMLGKHVTRNGGHIDKFIGDCIMVCFGIPKALENAPLSAVNTGIAMKNALQQFNREKNLSMPLDIHIGINTGPVIAGTVGSEERKDYTVMGDAVNLASRIEELSEIGQILVGPDTYRATQDDFEYRVLEPVKLKGKTESVPLYEVLSSKETIKRSRIESREKSASGTRSKTGYDRMIYSELVGRDKEMNQLHHLVTVLAMGKGGIANVIGEAGIGKSRLMAELKNDPAMKQVILLEGQAISMGRHLPFHPLIDLLKNWAGISEDDIELAQLSKLDKAVRAVHPAEADEIIPFMGTMMGIKLSGKYADRVKGIEGEALEKLIFKNIRELLIKGSELRPMIVRIEDIHWSDTSSIELLSSLFRLARNNRILFLNFFRPHYPETGDRFVKTAKEEFADIYTEIIIQPLDENESATLISNLINIKGIPQALKTQITSRAGGNPFFIEEVVRSLIDDGAVIRKGDTFEVTDKINAVTIPLTINEVLMSRIDRLDGETKNLIRTASVIGRYFFHKIITKVAVNISDIDKRLSHLEDIQLIRERHRMDELEYLFKHALAQEAAYESLLIQKRRELHLHVAHSIEDVFSDRLHEFYGMLAYHYSQAEELDKAEEYMLKAGEEAMKSSTSSEAMQYYRNALDIYMTKHKGAIDHIKIAGIEENIANAYCRRGLMVEAVDYYDRCIAHLGIKEYKNRGIQLFQVIVNLLKILRCLYLPSVKKKNIPMPIDIWLANIIFHRGQALAYTDPVRFVIDSIISGSRIFQLELADFKNGSLLIVASTSLFSFTGISFSISRKILNYIGNNIDLKNTDTCHSYFLYELFHNSLSGSWITEYDTVSLKYCLKIGDIWTASAYLVNIGWLSIELGNIIFAEEITEKLKALGQEYNDKTSEGQYYELLFHLYLKKRVLTGVSEILERGVEILRRIEQAGRTISLLGLKIRIEILQNDLQSAEKTISDAAALVANEITVLPLYYINYLMGVFLYHLSMLENSKSDGKKDNYKKFKKQAFIFGKKAVKVSKKVALQKTEALRLMGTYFWLTDKQKKAINWWKESIDEGERLGARPELARTFFEVGKRAPAQSKKIIGLTPAECLEKAETMFREMDLQWDIEELRKVRYHDK